MKTPEVPGAVTEPEVASSSAAVVPRDAGVTRRVVVLCLLLSAVFGYIIPIIDYKLFNTFLGGTHLPPGAIGVLLLLLLVVNPLLRVTKKLAFTRNEMLTVYISCLFSCLLPGHGGETSVISNLLAPFYYATPENKWLDILQGVHGLAPWLTPSLNSSGELHRTVFEGWYQGSSGIVPWAAWMVPLLFWVPFVLASYLMFGCLSVMLRGQWAEREALAFPLLRLPLELTEENPDRTKLLAPIFSNQLLWIGVGIAVFIQLLRGLHLYFPDVPEVPLSIDSGPLFSEAPWNQIGNVPILVYPIVVGITFLLTTEVAFSLWFFFWFIKAQYVIAYLAGFPTGSLPGATAAPGKAFTAYQVSGCYLAYVAIMLWAARSHLQHIARRAFGKAGSTPAEREEAMSYPAAFWGFVLSFALMWGATIFAGVRWDLALALWVSYLVIAIGLSRLVVEAGMLLIINQSMPLGGISKLFGDAGASWLAPANGLVPASLLQSGIVYHMRGILMPSFLHAFKLAHDRGIAARRLGVLLAGVITLSVVVSWITTIKLGYGVGGLQLGHKFFTQTGATKSVVFLDAINANSASPASNWFWLSFGAILTYGMMLARSRFLFFPLHPLGYLVCLVFPAEMFWTSIFLGWLIKVVIARFGGNEEVRRVTPLFLGLVLGDVMMMLFWLVVDGLTGRTGHLLMPG
jgi:hypothetical protein